MSINPETDLLIADMASKLDDLLSCNASVPCEWVGIRSGGVWLAEALAKRCQHEKTVGELDISFYRDDFTQVGLNPRVRPSDLPFSTEGRHLVLIDDVLMSGRTIRAAMNELFDFGRPARVSLVVLVDVGRRELPIHPDIVGCTLDLPENQRVKLRGPDPLRLEIQERGR